MRRQPWNERTVLTTIWFLWVILLIYLEGLCSFAGNVEQAAMHLLQLGGSDLQAPHGPAHQPRQQVTGDGGDLSQQARLREQRELEAALAASAREASAGPRAAVVQGRLASAPFGQGRTSQGVVQGFAVHGGSSGGRSTSVSAYNDEQMRRAMAESQVMAAASGPPLAPAFGQVPNRIEPQNVAPVPRPTAAVTGGMSYDEQMRKVMAESKKTALLDFERRAQELKVPSEPEDGAAGSAWLFFRIGDATIKRRFWSDNSIKNVLHFLQCHPLVFEQFEADDIQMVNMTCYPPTVVDIATDGSRTIQFMELWPSGQIAIQRLGDDPKTALPPAPDPAYL